MTNLEVSNIREKCMGKLDETLVPMEYTFAITNVTDNMIQRFELS